MCKTDNSIEVIREYQQVQTKGGVDILFHVSECKCNNCKKEYNMLREVETPKNLSELFEYEGESKQI